MIIECEKCGAKYTMEDEKVSPSGSEVECSLCQATFTVYRPEPEDSMLDAEQDMDSFFSNIENNQVAEGGKKLLDEDFFSTEKKPQRPNNVDFNSLEGLLSEGADEIRKKPEELASNAQDMSGQIAQSDDLLDGIFGESQGLDELFSPEAEVNNKEYGNAPDDLLIVEQETVVEQSIVVEVKASDDEIKAAVDLFAELDINSISEKINLDATQNGSLGMNNDAGQTSNLDLDAAYGIGSTPNAKEPEKNNKKLIILIILLLLLLLGAAGFGAYYMMTKDSAVAVQNPAIDDIILENVKQYFIQNEKEGNLLVVEGYAINEGQSAKRNITLEATLYDANNNPLLSKTTLAGNMLSQFQLQLLPLSEMVTRLENPAGISANNSSVSQGQRTPFMLIFQNVPIESEEFSVEIVGASDFK